jgi:ADP-L-glycero-D-manno-heptose 6-epimerase
VRVIVTGGAGFIGSALIWQLNREGVHDVLVVDELGTDAKWRNLAGLSFIDVVHKDRFLRMVEADAVSFEADAVVHLGACSSTTESDADYLLENNTRYTGAVAEWCLQRNVRFLYASSAATYGDGMQGFDDSDTITPKLLPLNMYGFSKHLFDMKALRSGWLNHMVGLKFFNVFGPNEYHKSGMVSMVYRAYHQIMDTGTVRLFRSNRPDYADGCQTRDFVYVKDCTEVIWWLLKNPHVNGLFNLGTGQARTWLDLAKAVFSAVDRPPKIEFIDLPENLRDKYQYHTEANMSKLVSAGCPLQPRSLEQAVEDYVGVYLRRGDRRLGEVC